jgi:hypothetical protein
MDPRGPVTTQEIWIGTVEISYTRENAPTLFKPAFTVITTWASNAEEFREKCTRMLEHDGWKLIGVDRSNPVLEGDIFSEEVEEMLERTRHNPNAIIFGTFYTYPVM